MTRFFRLFKKMGFRREIPSAKIFLTHKYDHFRSVLSGNNRILDIITDLEHHFYEDQPLTGKQLRDRVEDLIQAACQMVEDLNALGGGKYVGLYDALERIGREIRPALETRKTALPARLVVPLERLGREQAFEVGGKAANLGEILNRVKLPVPKGFAVTAYACHHFLQSVHLPEFIQQSLQDLNVEDTERLLRVCEEIRLRILKSRLPEDLEEALLRAAADLKRDSSPLRLAVRSSATSEDSEATFAGQHSTVLNVPKEGLSKAYKEVVASTFNPRAVYYRRSKGIPDEDVIMSVLCLQMVEARVSGVLYTVDPNDPAQAVILISALWGLGVGLVDGSQTADFFQVRKEDRKIERQEIRRKETAFYLDPHEGLRKETVPSPLKEQPCLSRSQIQWLVHYAFKLEDHYQTPLDIEWAIDDQGRLYVLQARPLGFLEGERPAKGPAVEEAVAGVPILLKGGATASSGVAAGKAYVLKSDHQLLGIPGGSILIAPQTSPRYVPIIGRVKAIVTDVGSPTGHMASVAREFRIPALVGTEKATAVIPHGAEITVDAGKGIIYQGRIEALLREKKGTRPFKGGPTYKALEAALKKIAPLHLVDPRQEAFRPEGCQTFHDITRFAHEMAMQEMFQIGETLEDGTPGAVRLRSSVPLNIYIVDLGGGLEVQEDRKEVLPGQVRSVPFLALYRGMTHPGVQWLGQNKISWRGFGSILMESILHDPRQDGDFGGPSYAILSEKYLNFSSRLGYHFTTLDTYCGQNINNNYITFFFKGGAADLERRSRRAELIGSILKKLGFAVTQKGDMVKGELKKHNSYLIQEKLDFLGRLMGAVRLLDMVLDDDGKVEWCRDQFFKGNYTFEPER